MATHKSDYANGLLQMPEPAGGEVVSVRMVVAIPSTNATNDMIHFGQLPQNCVPVDWMIDTDDLDSNGTPTLTLDVGIVDAAGTAISTLAADGGDEWLDGGTVGQAAGLTRNASVAASRVVADPTNSRIVGAKVMSGPATAAAGNIAMTLQYRAAQRKA